MAQLDRVTQQNAAMVSQANEAGRTLRDEANEMARSDRRLQASPGGNATGSTESDFRLAM